MLLRLSKILRVQFHFFLFPIRRFIPRSINICNRIYGWYTRVLILRGKFVEKFYLWNCFFTLKGAVRAQWRKTSLCSDEILCFATMLFGTQFRETVRRVVKRTRVRYFIFLVSTKLSTNLHSVSTVIAPNVNGATVNFCNSMRYSLYVISPNIPIIMYTRPIIFSGF